MLIKYKLKGRIITLNVKTKRVASVIGALVKANVDIVEVR